jgi:hypothetical protein
MPGVARVDHRTHWIGGSNDKNGVYTVTTPEASKEIYPRNGPQRKYHLGTDPKQNTTSERTPKKIPRTDQKENALAA